MEAQPSQIGPNIALIYMLEVSVNGAVRQTINCSQFVTVLFALTYISTHFPCFSFASTSYQIGDMTKDVCLLHEGFSVNDLPSAFHAKQNESAGTECYSQPVTVHFEAVSS